MSICMPCAKEIINNGLQARADSMRSISKNLATMVSAGQVTKAQADSFLKSAIALEDQFCGAADELLANFVANAYSPWDVPPNAESGA